MAHPGEPGLYGVLLMGRMWDALRRGGTSSDNEQQRAIPSPTEDSGPILADVEEVPFIEVGPQKSMEASPSVLAFSPSTRSEGAGTSSEEQGLSFVAPRHSPLATPEKRCVPLRTVFLATPETEPETPRMDTLARLIDFL